MTLTVAPDCTLRLGHISFIEVKPENQVKLAWDERPDMVDSAHRVINLVESNFSDTNVSNYHIAWQIDKSENLKFVKYYRVFRGEKEFLGITTSMFYVDKRVTFKPELVYTIEAIGWNQEKLDSI